MTSINRSSNAATVGGGVDFAIVTTLFFAWGFVTSNNDPLIAALRGIYALNFTEALMTQFAFFAAYAVMSLPAAALLSRLGPARTILAALALMISACLIVPLSSALGSYGIVLIALFMLASGITALQVAANPLAAVIGRPERAHMRLTLAQAFNSLGVVLGVHVGSSLMLSDAIFRDGTAIITSDADRTSALAAVDNAFLVIASLLAAIAALIWASRTRIGRVSLYNEARSPLEAVRSPAALFGVGNLCLCRG